MISPDAVSSALQTRLGWSVKTLQSVSGGDINQAFRITLETDQRLFLKANTSAVAEEMFRSEVMGLQEMARADIKTPSVIHQESCSSFSFLVLEWIDNGFPSANYWEGLGQSLAGMHQIKQAYYGWHQDGFIGTLPQPNTCTKEWVDFFWNHRLVKQFDLAVGQRYFSNRMIDRFGKLQGIIKELFPEEPPSLLHGDLWSGNVMVNLEGNAVLIDPAAYYGHREMDIAMTRLFGGFPTAFYEAYQEVYPLVSRWEERLAICQLYYVLVHVNLFGGGYVQQAEMIIKQYT